LSKKPHARSFKLRSKHYYPFGLRLGGLSTTTGTPNRYRFQRHELQDELGLNIYSTFYREYDPAIGRWWQVDPFDQFPAPYLGFGNNPINGTDPDGGYFWEKKNVRKARRYAKKTGGKFEKWKNKKGKTVASVSFSNEKGNSAKVFRKRAKKINTAQNLGKDAVERSLFFVLGAGNAFATDVFLGAGRTNPEDISGPESLRDAYASGQLLGDAAGTIVGVAEAIGGATIAAGGTALEVVTVGLASPIAIPTVVVGAGAAVHRTGMSAAAVNNLINNRLFAKGSKFQGGKKGRRDRGLKGYPDKFKKWFHRQWKEKGGPQHTPSGEIKEAFDEWKRLGKPYSN